MSGTASLLNSQRAIGVLKDFSGYHVVVGEQERYYFTDIIHDKTGIGMCTWNELNNFDFLDTQERFTPCTSCYPFEQWT